MPFHVSERRTLVDRLVIASAVLLFFCCGAAPLGAVDAEGNRATESPGPRLDENEASKEAADGSPKVLTSFAEIAWSFGRNDTDGLPVDLSVWINYWDRRDEAAFIANDDGAIYLAVPLAEFVRHGRLEPGTRVRVLGQLILQGHYVELQRVEFSGEIDEPQPKPVQIEDLSLGDLWSTRVATTGTIEEVACFGNRWIASVRSGDTSFLVHRFDQDGRYDWDQFVGKTVSIVGTLICETDYNGLPFRYVIRSNEFDPPLRSVEEASPDSRQSGGGAPVDQTPITTVGELRSAADIPPGTVFQVRGQLTSVAEHQGFLIESDGPEIYVHSALALKDSLGQIVSLKIRRNAGAGFQAIAIQSKAFRSVPPPPRVDAAAVDVRYLPYRGAIEANYVSSSSQGDRRAIILRDGATKFAAVLQAGDDEWRQMSLETARRVTVSGMLTPPPPDLADPSQDSTLAFSVELEDAGQLDVISRWWQLSPSTGITALAVVSMLCALGMICFATLWLRLQRTVHANRRLESQLLESQKMDSLGRLAGGVAHDFNNLLAGIASNLELIDRGNASADDQRGQCIASARRCTAQATKLVRSLLGFSRQANLELDFGDINDVVEEAVLLAKTSFTPDVKVLVRLGSDIPMCRFDHAQLEQVILNLLFNARDAVRDQAGTILVSTDELVDDSGNRVAQICVRDNGSGMDCETTARVFEPFFTTKKVGEGTGLGLALSYGIINQHGGTIECQSELGVGTEFRISLPAVSDADRPEPTVCSPSLRFAPAVDSGRGRSVPVRIDTSSNVVPVGAATGDWLGAAVEGAFAVLLIDDDDEVRRVARLSLEAMGHEVTAVSGGYEAIRQVERGTHFDAVILDLMMPEISGSETFCRLKSLRPELPIIICSGLLIEIESLKLVSGREPDATLSKPFQLIDLDRCLRQVCCRRPSPKDVAHRKSQGLAGQAATR